jgi:hypothetical protein
MDINEAAKLVLTNENKLRGVQRAFDVTTLIPIGKMIFDLIMQCREKKASSLKKAAKRPNLLQRIIVANAVDKHSDEPRRVRKETANAIFAAINESDEESLQELIDDVSTGS